MIYTRHVFMIGVILGRIFYRSMTDLIHWSPFCGTVPAEKDWERAILGGHLVGCSKVYSSKPILDSLALQIRNDGFKEHWVARDEDIDDITWGEFTILSVIQKLMEQVKSDGIVSSPSVL